MIDIPKKLCIGGQEIEVQFKEFVNGNCGECSVPAGWIRIADKLVNDVIQTDSSKLNTYYHELTHAILDTMGRHDLSDDEVFVNSFASFLTEAMKDARYIDKN